MSQELNDLIRDLEVNREATSYIPIADEAAMNGHPHADQLGELALNIRDETDFDVVFMSVAMFDMLLADTKGELKKG